jgi:hypothetical protein
MKRWTVTVPITGVVHVTVEADSANDAINRVMVEGEGDWPNDPEEWESHTVIAEGNVLYASVNRVFATLESDDEE